MYIYGILKRIDIQNYNVNGIKGNCIEIMGNIEDEAVQKYIKQQVEESREELLYSRLVEAFVTLPFEANYNTIIRGKKINSTVELGLAWSTKSFHNVC